MADRERLSAIAHREHPIAGPLSDDHVGDLIARLTLGPRSRILDVGCGPGEWIVRVLERFPDAVADAVDPSPWAIASLRERAAARDVDDRIAPHEMTIDAFDPPSGAYDAAMCLGSTHAFGGLDPTLHALGEALRPGGVMLVGDLFWARPSTREARAALDAGPNDFPDRSAGLRLRFVRAGLEVLHVTESDQDEWDAYESSWLTLAEYADEHPDDPDALAMHEAVRTHRAAYLEGYRGVLGYGVVLASTSPEPTSRRSNVS